MARKYVITSIKNSKTFDAGSKAKNDDRLILGNCGYTPLDISNSSSRIQKLFQGIWKIKKLIKMHPAKQYVIQYPLYSIFIIENVIKNIRKYTPDGQVILLIHDIEALRLRVNDVKYTRKELAVFNSVDSIIVHTDNMENKLRKMGVTTKMVVQGLFDYLNPQQMYTNVKQIGKISYAGNLQKSAFLKKINLERTHLEVFGTPKPTTDLGKNVEYQGAYPADELPKYLNADYGLVWDGTSLESSEGVFGDYTKYNSPHKASLYISSGLPVIVWKKAGIASIIEKNNLGLVVDNIEDLDEIVSDVTEEAYITMKKSVIEYGKCIREGKILMSVLSNGGK